MDISWQKLVVFGVALAFTGFLLWKYRPRLPLPRIPRAEKRLSDQDEASARARVREARETARTAKTPHDRATALFMAAESAAQTDEGLTAAMGLYLRSMRADATFLDPIHGITTLLRRERPELLESVLWRRLAQLKWSGDTAPAARTVVEALVALYRRDLRHRDRAKALQKLAGMI